ncbi:CBS domain-containing protein [Candidatus Nitrospira bockiana]
MTCEDIMTRNPTTCTPAATAQAAALIMSEEDVGIVPVVDPQTRRLVGVVTDRDLCLDVVAAGRNPHDAKVAESMHTNPITCRPEDDLQACLHQMRRHQVRRIPVVNEEGCCVGIISQKDLALALNEPDQLADTVKEISRPAHAA